MSPAPLESEFAAFACAGGAFQFYDPTDALAGTVYATEALTEVTEDIKAETKYNKSGTGKNLDSASSDAELTVKAKFARIHGSLIAAMHGYTFVRDDENGTSTLVRTPGASGKAFCLRAISKSASSDGSNVELVWYKLKIASPMPVALADTDYASYEAEFTAFETADGEWADVIEHDQRVTLNDLFAPVAP